jgi:hypothetical protein
MEWLGWLYIHMLMLRKAKSALRGNLSLISRSFFNFFLFLRVHGVQFMQCKGLPETFDNPEGADDVHWRLFLTQPVSPFAQRQLSTIYPLQGELVYDFSPSVWTSVHSTFGRLVVSNPFCDFCFRQLLQTV